MRTCTGRTQPKSLQNKHCSRHTVLTVWKCSMISVSQSLAANHLLYTKSCWCTVLGDAQITVLHHSSFQLPPSAIPINVVHLLHTPPVSKQRFPLIPTSIITLPAQPLLKQWPQGSALSPSVPSPHRWPEATVLQTRTALSGTLHALSTALPDRNYIAHIPLQAFYSPPSTAFTPFFARFPSSGRQGRPFSPPPPSPQHPSHYHTAPTVLSPTCLPPPRHPALPPPHPAALGACPFPSAPYSRHVPRSTARSGGGEKPRWLQPDDRRGGGRGEPHTHDADAAVLREAKGSRGSPTKAEPSAPLSAPQAGRGRLCLSPVCRAPTLRVGYSCTFKVIESWAADSCTAILDQAPASLLLPRPPQRGAEAATYSARSMPGNKGLPPPHHSWRRREPTPLALARLRCSSSSLPPAAAPWFALRNGGGGRAIAGREAPTNEGGPFTRSVYELSYRLRAWEAALDWMALWEWAGSPRNTDKSNVWVKDYGTGIGGMFRVDGHRTAQSV